MTVETLCVPPGSGQPWAGPRVWLEWAVQSLSEGLVLLNQEQVVIFANTRAQSLLGRPSEQLLGLEAGALWACPGLQPAASDEMLRAFHHALAETESYPTLSVNLRPHTGPIRRWARATGALSGRALSLSFFPVRDDTGSCLGSGLLLRDVTREHEAARRRDDLVNTVSHELRTPLTNILCSSDLLLTREFPETRRRHMLEIIHHEAKRLSVLINDFLYLRRLESGRLALTLQNVRLADVAGSVLAGFALNQFDHRARSDFPPDLPPVRADYERVGQALRNLLDNAFRYSPHGGQVMVRARVADHEVCVTVTDQGLGLPAEAIPRLFQRFYRVDAPDRNEIVGTGLGLAIVKEIIQAHGGRVWAESQGPGQGSTFGFTLPLAAPEKQDESQ